LNNLLHLDIFELQNFGCEFFRKLSRINSDGIIPGGGYIAIFSGAAFPGARRSWAGAGAPYIKFFHHVRLLHEYEGIATQIKLVLILAILSMLCMPAFGQTTAKEWFDKGNVSF
jgi:hypothetical protein